MNAAFRIARLLALCLIIAVSGTDVYAKDPGESCDPDSSTGYTARVASLSGEVRLHARGENPLGISTGSIIPGGARIETGPGDTIALALEDGTADRSSRLHLESNTQAVLSGGLYCSDLRPKADGGRWAVREIGIDLIVGGLSVDVAENVSYSFNLELNTPNAAIKMMRRSAHRVNAEVLVSGFEDRKRVPLMEHPDVKKHATAFLMGRCFDDLNERERKGVMTQAAMAALGMGLIDLEKKGVLDHPRMQPIIAMLGQGRSLPELGEEERATVIQSAGAMALQNGLLNPEEMEVYNHPDEMTHIAVTAGKMRVHNKHRGRSRDETVELGAKTFSRVKGYDAPTPPVRAE